MCFKNHFKNFSLIITLLMLVMLALVQSAALGQESGSAVKFAVNIDQPAVTHGEEREDWDNRYTDPGTVIYHDGLFHMFRNGFKGWPASVEIGYLTSEDGLTWTEVTPDPVFWTDDAPFDTVAALASSALIEDDGTWVLYFYLWPRTGGGSDPGSVARATASDPLGPWTMDETLVLIPGSVGSWDAAQVSAPSVVKTDQGYQMFYTGISADGEFAIGMATSADGITWQKYDDPETTNALYAESDPVFVKADSPDAWDGTKVHQSRVVLTPDGLVMMYRSSVGADRDKAYGLATSSDGINWQRVGTEPVFSDADTGLRGIWFSELEYHDGTYYAFFEIQRGFLSQTDIYVGTYQGSLR